jgi:hypothetical protein
MVSPFRYETRCYGGGDEGEKSYNRCFNGGFPLKFAVKPFSLILGFDMNDMGVA